VFPHLLGLLIYNIDYSIMSINDIEKKRGRGRPSKEVTPVLVRLPNDQVDALDKWIVRQKSGDAALSRPEAIRQLIELGLKAKK
jgi:cytochrome c553